MCEARLLFEHRKAWGDRTNASVPAMTRETLWFVLFGSRS
jgi:hypothetical protein